MKETSKNFLYNVLYQILILIIPLVTTPYVSRALGANNIGIYSYTYSIVYYFMLFSMLGINNYGSRVIAKCNDDIEKRSNKFWNIYTLQLSLTLIFSILYMLFIALLAHENKLIMIIQQIYLLSVAFDINWFFFGIEKFKITISRNIIIKLITLILIFIFVKNPGDLWKYTMIMSVGTLLSQLYLWLHVKKYIKKSKIYLKKVFSHLKHCIILFIPVIAYSIYRVMDKTMIGYFANTTELGNYESAEKIINIPLSFIAALGTVMIPYMSKTKDSSWKKDIVSTFELCFCFILPMSFGLYIISNDFSNIFFGAGFEKTGNIIKLLTPTIIFGSISNVIRTNYLIPKEKDFIYVKSTIIGAVLNLICNIIFIKQLGAYGACIGTILAEFIVMSYQIFKTLEIFDYKNIIKIFFKSFYKTVLMSLIILLIGIIIIEPVKKIIFQILVGGIFYFIINYNFIVYNFLGIKIYKKKKAKLYFRKRSEDEKIN